MDVLSKVEPSVNCSMSSFGAILKDRKDQGLMPRSRPGCNTFVLFFGNRAQRVNKFTTV